jgi:calcineurin-like phosphoesterase family protein
MAIFFTSDQHYGHGNVIWYCKRPFADAALIKHKRDYDDAVASRYSGSSTVDQLKRIYKNALYEAVKVMDAEMIKKHNAKIQPDDTVYMIGDVAFYDEAKTGRILDQLNGKKILVYGNHDKGIKMSNFLQSKFEKCVDYLEINVGNQMIVMSHYAMLVWNKSHHGSWMLHGHSHGSLKYPYDGKILDVGVDAHSMDVLSMDDVRRIMDKKNTQPVDHHA